MLHVNPKGPHRTLTLPPLHFSLKNLKYVWPSPISLPPTVDQQAAKLVLCILGSKATCELDFSHKCAANVGQEVNKHNE